MVAIGTKDSAGAGFDDYGGELELHNLDVAVGSKNSAPVGKVKANSRFSSLAWSEMTAMSREFPLGLIAGGMVDGHIHVWDPAKLVANDPAPLLMTAEQHSGPINGLQFNPHKEWSHSLASGGSDGELFVMSLERPDAPVSYPGPDSPKHVGGITKVAWNTATHHILASATGSGSTFVWDLKARKSWCEIRDPLGGPISDIAWNPDEGLSLITASGDDRNPVLKVWDLRTSTSLPLATLSGHTEGILSISWCPTDTSLLLSCGKDNRSILWDLFKGKAVYDLASHGGAGQGGQSSDVFGGLASAAGSRRYQVAWSPCLPAVISACSFDRKVQFYSMIGAKSNIGRAPKWLRKQCGASFGFGGKLVTFGAAPTSLAGGKRQYSARILQVVEDPELSTACDAFHQAIAQGDYKSFCEHKSLDAASSAGERQVWGLMRVICYESNAREQLRTHLGFDSAVIADEATRYLGTQGGASGADNGALSGLGGLGEKATAEDVFGGGDAGFPPAPPAMSLAKPTMSAAASAATAEMVAAALAGEAAEPTIRNAVVVGNFEAAVDCCLEAGLMAEALLLAQCGDQPLWLKTQAAFFERQKQRFGFLSILHAIIKNELMEYVLQSDLSKWRQTLAVLSTYGKSDEFPSMCEALAARLETEARDVASATLCFMCAANVVRTVEFWTAELKAANVAAGQTNTKALQRYIEKVVVFTNANPGSDLGLECSAFFAEYAGLLASQGRMDVAGRYLKGGKPVEDVLIDRLYHAGLKPAGSRPPAFPFKKTNVVASVARVAEPAVQVKSAAAAGATGGMAGAAMPAQATQGGAGAAQELAPGWTQLVDPASGRPYYVNQQTGQSVWEAPMVPRAAPAPAPAPVSVAPQQQPLHQQMGHMGMGAAQHHPHAQQQQQQQQMQPQPQQQQQYQQQQYQQQQQPQQQYQQPQHQQQPQPQPYQGSMPGMAHAHGMQQGAPASFQQPQAYQQPMQQQPMQAGYGAPQQPAVTVMQPQAQAMGATGGMGAYAPMQGAPGQGMQGMQGMAPAAAQAPAASAPAPAPVPVVQSAPVDASAAHALQAIFQSVAAAASPAEKRQIDVITPAMKNLADKVEANQVSAEVMQRIAQMVEDLQARNFVGANAVQQDLANTAWNAHKEWIKGVKLLITLASKR